MSLLVGSLHWASAVGAERRLGDPLLEADLVEGVAASDRDIVDAFEHVLAADGALFEFLLWLRLQFHCLRLLTFEHLIVGQLEEQVNQNVLLVLVRKERLAGRLVFAQQAPFDVITLFSNEAANSADDRCLLLHRQLRLLS